MPATPTVPDLAAAVTTRPLRPDDAEAVFELTAAAELFDMGHVMIELEDVRSDWAQPSYDLGRQSVGYFRDGVLLAYGEVRRNRLEAYVHPDHRGQGIGTALFAWGVATARELDFERIGQTVPLSNTGALGLFERHGCTWLWSSWILELPEGATIEETPLPAGYRLRDFDPGRDAHDVYQTTEDAFNEWPNRVPSTFEDWAAMNTGRGDYEPWQIIVVVRDAEGEEQIVGICKVNANAGEGWVDTIAVNRAHRRQGLARALLVEAFARARERGAKTSRLNTDSRTGALGLYERVGMVVVETYEHHALELS